MLKLCCLTLFAIAVAAVAGCGYFSQFSNVEHARDLRVGMSKAQVLELMGEPIADLEGATPDIWFYYVYTRWHDGYTTEDECMPVVFAQGKVIGFGNMFYNQYRLVEKNLYQPDNYQPDVTD